MMHGGRRGLLFSKRSRYIWPWERSKKRIRSLGSQKARDVPRAKPFCSGGYLC